MSLRPALLLLALTGFAADAPKTVTPAPKPAARPQPPTRPFDGPTAPKFIRLDGKPGATPSADAYGDFVVGPDYVAAPETKASAVASMAASRSFGSRSSHQVRRSSAGTPPNTVVRGSIQSTQEAASTFMR